MLKILSKNDRGAAEEYVVNDPRIGRCEIEQIYRSISIRLREMEECCFEMCMKSISEISFELPVNYLLCTRDIDFDIHLRRLRVVIAPTGQHLQVSPQ